MRVGDLVKWRDGDAIGVVVELAKDAPSTKIKVLWRSGSGWYYAYSLEKICK